MRLGAVIGAVVAAAMACDGAVLRVPTADRAMLLQSDVHSSPLSIFPVNGGDGHHLKPLESTNKQRQLKSFGDVSRKLTKGKDGSNDKKKNNKKRKNGKKGGKR